MNHVAVHKEVMIHTLPVQSSESSWRVGTHAGRLQSHVDNQQQCGTDRMEECRGLLLQASSVKEGKLC